MKSSKPNWSQIFDTRCGQCYGYAMQSVHAKFQKNSLLGRLIPSGPGVIAVFGPNPFDSKFETTIFEFFIEIGNIEILDVTVASSSMCCVDFKSWTTELPDRHVSTTYMNCFWA